MSAIVNRRRWLQSLGAGGIAGLGLSLAPIRASADTSAAGASKPWYELGLIADPIMENHESKRVEQRCS